VATLLPPGSRTYYVWLLNEWVWEACPALFTVSIGGVSLTALGDGTRRNWEAAWTAMGSLTFDPSVNGTVQLRWVTAPSCPNNGAWNASVVQGIYISTSPSPPTQLSPRPGLTPTNTTSTFGAS
jgi:hypothetical protein